MTTLTAQQIAGLKASIAAKYDVASYEDRFWFVVDLNTLEPVSPNDYVDALDAEAEMEAIIQDEVKAAMEEME